MLLAYPSYRSSIGSSSSRSLVFRPRVSSSASFVLLIVRLHRGSGQMPARSGVGLACKLAVASAGQTAIVFYSRRVVVVIDHCMMEGRVGYGGGYYNS